MARPGPYIVDAGATQYDVVIGSRYIPGGSIGGWSLVRKFMSWGINCYSRVILAMRTRDCSSGFRCYRVAKLREIDFDRMVSKGYSFEEEFLYRCFRVGCRVEETPIHFENRKHGKSKINLAEVLWSLWALILVSIRG